jgi:hypothetical protein
MVVMMEVEMMVVKVVMVVVLMMTIASSHKKIPGRIRTHSDEGQVI